MSRVIQIALTGAGMFGGEVYLRTYSDLQTVGIAPQLSRIGLDNWAREFAPIRFELVAIGTRTAASARRAVKKFGDWTGHQPRAYFGDRPWTKILKDFPNLDMMAVATPDHLHTAVILAALHAGAHVLTEKPMCLDLNEADRIIELANRQNRIVGVDMHKRYDPDHRRIREVLCQRIGAPLYGSAYLEEPIEVSTSTFKWVEQSDPFTYVGPHWVDLIYHYYHSKPVSLTAVGQKKRLLRDGIDAYDAVQVRVDFDNGMSINFHNNWITPSDFEGPVNQGHEIVGTDGKIESDQQYRGLRWWRQGEGSRTANNHFTREVPRSEGQPAYVGYGVDSLIAGLAAICRMKFFGADRKTLIELYPTAEDARITVAIVHAARVVRDLNFKYLAEGKGACVSARFGLDGVTIVDPHRAGKGTTAVFQKIYNRPL